MRRFARSCALTVIGHAGKPLRRVATAGALLLVFGGAVRAQEPQQAATSGAQQPKTDSTASHQRHARPSRRRRLKSDYSPQWGGRKLQSQAATSGGAIKPQVDMASPTLRASDMSSPKLRTNVDTASPKLHANDMSSPKATTTPAGVQPAMADGSVRFNRPNLAGGAPFKADARRIRRDPPNRRGNGQHPRHRTGYPPGGRPPCPPGSPPSLYCEPQRPVPGHASGSGTGMQPMHKVTQPTLRRQTTRRPPTRDGGVNRRPNGQRPPGTPDDSLKAPPPGQP